MSKLKAGFYTALGTPVDENGNIVEASLRRHIEMQIEAGASGLLLLGSMGNQAAIKLDAWAKAARIASDAVAGRVALFVGAMDNSVWRVKERLDLIRDVKLDGIVLTTPYYSISNDVQLFEFFSSISDYSAHPLYLYDLAVVTKVKINFPLVEKLIKAGKVAGIKTGDIVLARQLTLAYPDFEVLYSNIDAFDVAMSYGINKVLDGMFACTPKNAKKFVESYFANDKAGVSKYLNNILTLRDQLLGYAPTALLCIFSLAMNQLGMEGIFCPDYWNLPLPGQLEKVTEQLKAIGEL